MHFEGKRGNFRTKGREPRRVLQPMKNSINEYKKENENKEKKNKKQGLVGGKKLEMCRGGERDGMTATRGGGSSDEEQA